MATVSKTNSKLPKVKKIGFIKKTKVKKKIKTSIYKKIYCGTNGQFSASLGFKQTSKAYPYQIQYRHRSRYTLDIEQEKGTRWQAWSDWKATAAISGVVPAGGTQTLYPVNYWLKSNTGVNKKGAYKTFYTFTNYAIESDFDARQFEFRVRTFNRSKSRHSNWTNGTVTAYKKAAIDDFAALQSTDGGIRLKFNYKWSRDCTVTITSIIHNKEILKKSISKRNLTLEDFTSTSTPAYRSGYQGAYININLSSLNTALKNGDAFRIKGYMETGDGAKTSFERTLVIVNPEDPSIVEDLAVSIDSISYDNDTKLLTVTATKEGNTDATEIGANVSYIYNENQYSIEPLYEDIDLNGTSTFVFSPPFNSQLFVLVGIRANSIVYTDSGTSASEDGLGYWFNKENDLSICGVAWGNSNLNIKTTPSYESSLPIGRDNSVIFYGDNSTTAISFSATIIDKDNVYGGDYQRFAMWDNIRRNQGVYYLRSSRGELYKVGITGVSLVKKQPALYELTIDMTEVL